MSLPITPCSPAFEVLSASQTSEPAVHHDGQACAERFTLFHAVGDSVSTAGPSLPAQGPGSVPTLSSLRVWHETHLCDVRTTERPSRTTDSKLFQRNRRALGSMPVVGSSCIAGADLEPGGTPVTVPDLLEICPLELRSV